MLHRDSSAGWSVSLRSSRLYRHVLGLALFPLLLVSILVVALSSWERAADNQRMIQAQRDMMVKIRQQGVRDVVEAAQTTVKAILAKHDGVTVAARAEAALALRSLRFEGENYVFVVDFDGVTQVQPVAPAHEGKDNTGVQDAEGRFFIREMLQLARKQGGGFYEYDWKNPRTGAVETKYSYAGSIPELGWMVGAGAYVTDIDQAMQGVEAQAKASLDTALWRLVGLALAVLLVIAVVVGRMARQMAARIGSAARAIQEIGEEVAQGRGDLTRRIPVSGDDEIGEMSRHMNGFLETLQGMLIDVRGSLTLVSQVSVAIAQHSEELASRSEQAGANLQQTSAAMEEITSTVQHSAGAAVQADQLAQGAAKVTRAGEESMQRAQATMGEILQASQQIAEIVQMIDTIAFQTNILALNASVEAARAGEQGRGFAVVAQEVRTLASRSAEAAREIRELIQRAGEQIRNGERAVDETAGTMRGIVGQISQASVAVAEITRATREQEAGIDQINVAVAEMDAMTQQNTAMVQALSRSAGQMMAQAEQLSRRMEGFRLEV